MGEFLAGVLVGLVVLVLVLRRRPRDSAVPLQAPVPAAAEPTAVKGPDLGHVLDAIPLGVVVIDRNGGDIARNAAATAFTGTRHADVLLNASVDRQLRLALEGKVSVEQVQLAGPPPTVVIVRAAPFQDGGALATVEDITERFLVDQVRTDFVANVSHELKTPVGAISVLAETLEGETDDELVVRLAGRMVAESQRMARTIDDLLELSRIEMGGDMLTAQVNMSEVVWEAVDRATALAARSGVEIDTRVLAGDTTVTGDHFQLVSAVGNLVENAVKYSDGKGAVTVSLIPLVSSVDVEVTDSGIGIPPASIDRIFERFYRVDKSRGRSTGGTGLGLSIVRRVITNHGGEVNVRSHEGEGSTFTVRLPRAGGRTTGNMVGDDESRPEHE
ncbi:MAG: sensor histidine kinase [Actinomycetota bacterium]